MTDAHPQAPSQPPLPASDTQPTPEPSQPHEVTSNAPDADADAKQLAGEVKEDGENVAQNLFSSWGIDVNAVTTNIGIGNIFTSDEKSEVEKGEVSGGEVKKGEGEEGDIGATASHIANAATQELEHASRAAQQTFGKAAEELGRGWGTLNSFLDDMLTPETNTGGDMQTRFKREFAELEGAELVDEFTCALIQKYRCYLNSLTAEKVFVLKGRMFVCTGCVCVCVDGELGSVREVIQMDEISKIQRARGMIRVLRGEQSMILGEFESETHYDGALGLLEHLRGERGEAG